MLCFKAIATDFEVVRPEVGVVCSMWVWSVQCGCGFVLLDIKLVLNIMGSPWIDKLNAI